MRPKPSCPNHEIFTPNCLECQYLAREEKKRLALAKRRLTRRAMNQACLDLGLTKIRGNLGGTYWE